MNLISCEHCGVVLDKDQLIFPYDLVKDDGSINEESAVWNGEEYVPKIDCPVCDGDIMEE